MDDYLTGSRSLPEFLEGYGIKFADVPPKMALDLSLRDLSYEYIWAWCQLAMLFGRSLRATPIICSLLARDDHKGHEDLADTLQNLRDPRSVDALFDRANRRLPYLDYNDGAALARKCVWALHDIGTAEAIAKLSALTNDTREEVSSTAFRRLEALRERQSGAEIPRYRLARNSHLGPF